jgi:hypothetical protein
MRIVRAIVLAAVGLAMGPATASADATLFVGANMSPANRVSRGFAIGAGLLVFGFEFEYSDTTEAAAEAAPSLRTGMGNVLIQTPFTIAGIQPYFTTGLGVYHESLETESGTGFGLNTGGGAKVSLFGPLRLLIDYRVFNLANSAMTSPAHRVYAGLNLKF